MFLHPKFLRWLAAVSLFLGLTVAAQAVPSVAQQSPRGGAQAGQVAKLARAARTRRAVRNRFARTMKLPLRAEQEQPVGARRSVPGEEGRRTLLVPVQSDLGARLQPVNPRLAMQQAREQAVRERTERLSRIQLTGAKRQGTLQEAIADSRERRALHRAERQERVRERVAVISDTTALRMVSRRKSPPIVVPMRSYSPGRRNGVTRGKKRGGAYFRRTYGGAPTRGRNANNRNRGQAAGRGRGQGRGRVR